jgi:NADH dehydrogenase
MDRMLLELPEKLGIAAAKSLRKRGVEIRLGAGAGATEIYADSVKLTDGTVLPAGTVICTIGTRPNALLEQVGLPTERGRIVANADFSISNANNLWALGDCAQVLNMHDGKTCPPTAQFAVRQAKVVADNILAKIAGAPTKEFNYKSLGSMAAIGHQKGVALVMGINISGLIAWLIWRAYYLFLMPTWGRKIRIYIEWTWGMFFPPDITHLRFNRSEDQEMK